MSQPEAPPPDPAVRAPGSHADDRAGLEPTPRASADPAPTGSTTAGPTTAGPTRDASTTGAPATDAPRTTARDQFGGLQLGAAFFGYLVTVAMVVLLGAIVTAVASALGQQLDFRPSDLTTGDATTIGIVSGVVLLLVLLVGYYTGGYVAGRMSRFDGARQGLGVWVIGLVLAIVAGVLGVVFGDQYNVLDQIDLPRVPIDRDNLGWGALIAAAVVLVGTLLAAVGGGTVGRRYHGRVDRAAGFPPRAD